MSSPIDSKSLNFQEPCRVENFDLMERKLLRNWFPPKNRIYIQSSSCSELLEIMKRYPVGTNCQFTASGRIKSTRYDDEMPELCAEHFMEFVARDWAQSIKDCSNFKK